MTSPIAFTLSLFNVIFTTKFLSAIRIYGGKQSPLYVTQNTIIMTSNTKFVKKVYADRMTIGVCFFCLFLYCSPVYSVWVKAPDMHFAFDNEQLDGFMHGVIFDPGNECKPMYMQTMPRPRTVGVHEKGMRTSEGKFELRVDDRVVLPVPPGQDTSANEETYSIYVDIDGTNLPADMMQGQRLYSRAGSSVISVSLKGSSTAMKAAYQACLKEIEAQTTLKMLLIKSDTSPPASTRTSSDESYGISDLRQDMPYSEAREIILDAGWQVDVNRDASRDDDNVEGWKELISCPMTGPCRLEFTDIHRRRLIVLIVGAGGERMEDEPSKKRVSSWYVEQPSSKQEMQKK